MSEKKEESLFSVLSHIRKFHPFVLFVIIFFMILSAQLINANLTLEKKIIPLTMSVFFYFIAAFFEIRRIEKEEELKERGLAKEGPW